MEYQRQHCNRCCFSSLEYAFAVSEELVSVKKIKMRITALLFYTFHEYTYKIKFTNEIMLDKERNKGEKCLHYKLEQCKEKGRFDIMNIISEHVTLVQLMDYLGNVNHAVV